MALTNNAELAARMRRMRTHGITRVAVEMERSTPPSWYYEQLGLGYNYRMTDIQAAVGREQLKRLPGIVQARRKLADRYKALLADAIPRPEKLQGATEPFAQYLARSIVARVGSTWGIGEGGAAGPPNRYGDPAGHAWVAVSGPAEATRHVLTGLDDRSHRVIEVSYARIDEGRWDVIRRRQTVDDMLALEDSARLVVSR